MTETNGEDDDAQEHKDEDCYATKRKQSVFKADKVGGGRLTDDGKEEFRYHIALWSSVMVGLLWTAGDGLHVRRVTIRRKGKKVIGEGMRGGKT